MKDILETENNEDYVTTKKQVKKTKVVGGWTQLDNRLFWQGRYLTANAKWVYATLRSFKNNDTGKTFPSYDAIVERSGLSRPKVAEGLRELEKFSWIAKSKRFSKSTNYNLSYPAVWQDKSQGVLTPDQTCPTKEQASTWANRLRSERKIKDARRKKKRGWQEAQEAIERKRAEEMEVCNCGDDVRCDCPIPF